MSMYMELAKAADILVRELLCVKPGEDFLIYADTASEQRVVEATAAAGHTAGGTVTVVLYETRPEIAMEPPRPLAAAMKNSDVICEFAKQYLIHTQTYRDALAAGARHLCLTGMTSDMMIRCIGQIDYSKMVELGEVLRELTHKGSEIRITTPAGTDLGFEKRGREVTNRSGVVNKPGQWQMFGGQCGLAPLEETINGILVFDGSIWPPDDLGLLREPVILEIVKGKATEIRGGNEATIFRRWLDSFNDPNMRNIAHVCYGFNPGARLTGRSLEDERVFGVVEFGLGSQAHYYKGKAGLAKAHTDGILLEPTVEIDGQVIERDGKYTHPKLAKLAEQLKGS